MRGVAGETGRSRRAAVWLALSLLMATGIAAADALTGETLNLIGLFALPPLLAATGLDPRRTAVVSAYCVSLAIASGVWDDIFGQLNEHVIRVLTVMVAAAIAVWVAHLRTSLISTRRRTAALGQAGLLLENALDPRSVVERTARLAVPLLADLAAVELTDGTGEIRRAATAGGNLRIEQLMESQQSLGIDPASSHPAALAIRTGTTQVVPELPPAVRQEIAQGGEHLDFLDRIGMRWGVYVPLKARGRVHGALGLGAVTARSLDPEDIRAAEELARRAALALEAARLHTNQVATSRSLQEGILPERLETIPGVRVAGTITPGGEGTEVGGDVYDVFASGSSRWAAAIADVCGKGPRAASLASLVRHTLRANALGDPGPSEALHLLNGAMIGQVEDGRFCTVAYATLERTGGGLRASVSLGGHPPVMVLRADGAVEAVGSPGSLLGVLPAPRLTDEVVELGPGDSLVFFTDGLIEAGRDNALGIGRVESLLGKSWGLRPEEIAERLAREAVQFEKAGPRDDVAILVLQLEGGFRQPGFRRARTGAEPVSHQA